MARNKVTVIGAGNVGVDTAVFIYFIEEHPQFLSAIIPLFGGFSFLQIWQTSGSITVLLIEISPLN